MNTASDLTIQCHGADAYEILDGEIHNILLVENQERHIMYLLYIFSDCKR